MRGSGSLRMYLLLDCVITSAMRDRKMITVGVSWSMKDKIPHANSEDAWYPWVWPRTVEGNLKRVAFCKEKADEIRHRDEANVPTDHAAGA